MYSFLLESVDRSVCFSFGISFIVFLRRYSQSNLLIRADGGGGNLFRRRYIEE
jgi:hypothetical protein